MPNGNTSKSTTQHSPVFNRIYQTLNQMSEQQLDQIHDTLVKYVEEKPFCVPQLGTNQTIAEAQINHAEFCKKLFLMNRFMGVELMAKLKK